MTTLDKGFGTSHRAMVSTAEELEARAAGGPPAAVDPEHYPMLVTFEDLDDPTSVNKINPDDLAASFGEGVELKRITVQLTDDPVTTGIDERLEWLERPFSDRERNSDFPTGIPLGDFKRLFRKD